MLGGHNRGPDGVHLVILGGGALLGLIALAATEHQDQAGEEGEYDAGHDYSNQSGRGQGTSLRYIGTTNCGGKREKGNEFTGGNKGISLRFES